MNKIFRLLREEFNLPNEARLCFTDIRRKNQIPLWHIVTQFFLMPFFSIRNFLALDIKSRQKSYTKLFKSKRKMISSDSTVQRILRWISPEESRRFPLQFSPGSYQSISGYDGRRMCEYDIAITEDSYKGFPLKIIRVTETHSTRKDD